MSTALNTKPVTQAKRIAEAARLAGEALHLDNQKLLGALLAELALEEAQQNPAFAERLSARYTAEAQSSRTPRPTRAASRPPKVIKPKRQYTPIRHDATHEINFAAPLDPYHLFSVFGSDQLPLILDEFTVTRLKEAVAAVQKRHPGTKPRNARDKVAVIEYVVQHVVTGN